MLFDGFSASQWVISDIRHQALNGSPLPRALQNATHLGPTSTQPRTGSASQMNFSISLCSAENIAVFIAVTAWKPRFAYANHMHLCKFTGESYYRSPCRIHSLPWRITWLCFLNGEWHGFEQALLNITFTSDTRGIKEPSAWTRTLVSNFIHAASLGREAESNSQPCPHLQPFWLANNSETNLGRCQDKEVEADAKSLSSPWQSPESPKVEQLSRNGLISQKCCCCSNTNPQGSRQR